MFLGAQKRTAGRPVFDDTGESHFRKREVEHHQTVGAAFERCDQPGAGALMRLMHQIGIAAGGIAEIDGEAMREAAREGFGADIGAEVDGVHAVDHLPQRFEIGMNCRAFGVGDIVAEADEDAVPDDLIVPPIMRARFPENTAGGSGSRPRIRSAAFSATMMVGALVLDEGTRGMTDASPTRRPSMPRSRSPASPRAMSSRAHPAGADRVMVGLAACAQA